MAKFISNKDKSPQAIHAENGFSAFEEPVHGDFQLEDDMDAECVKKLIRMVDWRIMPALGMLYAVSLIDRVNLAAVSLLKQ